MRDPFAVHRAMVGALLGVDPERVGPVLDRLVADGTVTRSTPYAFAAEAIGVAGDLAPDRVASLRRAREGLVTWTEAERSTCGDRAVFHCSEEG